MRLPGTNVTRIPLPKFADRTHLVQIWEREYDEKQEVNQEKQQSKFEIRDLRPKKFSSCAATL
jgi:hypothetical protein